MRCASCSPEHTAAARRVTLAGRPQLVQAGIEADDTRSRLKGSLRNWRGQLSAELDEPFETGGPLARFVWFGGRRSPWLRWSSTM